MEASQADHIDCFTLLLLIYLFFFCTKNATAQIYNHTLRIYIHEKRTHCCQTKQINESTKFCLCCKNGMITISTQTALVQN